MVPFLPCPRCNRVGVHCYCPEDVGSSEMIPTTGSQVPPTVEESASLRGRGGLR